MSDARPDETNNAPEPPSIGDLPTLGEGAAPKHPAVEPPSIGDLPTEGEWAIRDDKRFHSRRWQPGEAILGRYVVLNELGQGGMGVVYGCYDRVGGVKVAVKALPPELAHNDAEMEEVRDNFRLVYKLAHPNIASAKTLERDERGECFLVMDIAEGESLRQWIRRKRKARPSAAPGPDGRAGPGGGIPLAETIPVLRQIAAALDYAHAKKVVHRDVKPGNVMIAPNGEVKVLDFGLAAQIRTSLSRASQAYRGTSGTAPYMAPEQWEGKPQEAKTDQYALAAMAYEMLAGHLPFENAERLVLKDAVLHGTVAPVPGLPAKAMDALRRGLAKRAEERFGSCGAFVAALEGKTKLTMKNGAIRSAGGKAGMRKKAGGWAWVASLALAAGAGAWLWHGKGPDAGWIPFFVEKLRLEAAFPGGEAKNPAEDATGREESLDSDVGEQDRGEGAGKADGKQTGTDGDANALPESGTAGAARYEIIPWTQGWHAAKADAEARGGHLATITSEAEWEEVCRLFSKEELRGCWLGATDEAKEGVWQWVTGEPFGFVHWMGGEPNNDFGYEHYLGIFNAPSLPWNDCPNQCRDVAKYLFERESVPQGGAKRDAGTAKRIGGNALPDAGTLRVGRYALVPWTQGWHAAKADAESRGGHLATITSRAEWEEVCRLFPKKALQGCWLGATDEKEEGVWQWVTGEPFAFASWGSKQPDNALAHEHYLGTISPSVVWNDYPKQHGDVTRYLLEFEEGGRMPIDITELSGKLRSGTPWALRKMVREFEKNIAGINAAADAKHERLDRSLSARLDAAIANARQAGDLETLLVLTEYKGKPGPAASPGIPFVGEEIAYRSKAIAEIENARVARALEAAASFLGKLDEAKRAETRKGNLDAAKAFADCKTMVAEFAGKTWGQDLEKLPAKSEQEGKRDKTAMPAGSGLAKGLVAYWPFDGNAKDASGNGNDGTVNGATLTADRNGKSDGAYYFGGYYSDGFKDVGYIEVPNSDSLYGVGQKMTIAAWIRIDQWCSPDGRGQNHHASVLCKGYRTRQYSLQLESDCEKRWLIRDGCQLAPVKTVPATGSWHHVAVTDDGKTLTAYVDGVAVASKASDRAGKKTTESLYIGMDRPGALEYFNGAMDDVAVWARALTAGEVARLAEREAWADRARRQVSIAKLCADAKKWEKCLAAAEAALDAEPGNAVAQRLKAEAERNLKPYVRIKATLNGREVSATITEGAAESGLKTPVTVPLEKGGSHGFAAECKIGGKQYVGRTTVNAMDRGVTEAAIALSEVKENAAGRTKTVTLPGGAAMEMVWCPPGRFTMGSPPGEEGRDDDERQHPVTLTKGFWMAKTEVTQKQWKSVMGNNPSNRKGDDLPVENVSWDECVEFCRKAGNGLQLPTEAQWEYACRADSAGAYGETGKLDALGWYSENSGDRTHPVGQKQPNAWGLLDMRGNVWEWCADWYGGYPDHAVANPTGVASGGVRILRGGGFWGDFRSVRSADRHGHVPDGRGKAYGFRPAAR